eukprot:534158_1
MISIQELVTKYKNGSLSPVQYTKQQLTKLKRINRDTNAVTRFLNEKDILKCAQQSADRYKNGTPLSIFDGVVITIKDINSHKCRGLYLTNGSAIPEAVQIPEETVAHIDLMLRAGAILIAQTTSPEIGFKATTNSIQYGVTRNSRNLKLTSGGSSGGAATLCAAGIANLNFGSDGGGSIRIPSSCCGVIGLKPSYGIGYVGDFPFLSHVCPLVINMDDLRLYMEYVCNQQNCHLWNTRIPKQVFKSMNFSREYILNKEFKTDLKIGISKTLGGIVPEKYIDPRVWKHVSNAVQLLKNKGFNVESVTPKFSAEIQKRYFFILANLWRATMFNGYSAYVNDKNEHLVDPVLMRILKKGQVITSSQLYQSLKDRDEVKKVINDIFDVYGYDLIITPTLCILPPPAWTTQEESSPKRFQIPGLMGSYTGLFNLTHNPAISINCGFEKSNIPVGLQIVGPMYKDDLVMKFANMLQKLCGDIKIAKL